MTAEELLERYEKGDRDFARPVYSRASKTPYKTNYPITHYPSPNSTHRYIDKIMQLSRVTIGVEA